MNCRLSNLKNWKLLIILIVGGLTRLVLLYKPVPTVIEKLSNDDFFYYLTIARNISEGSGAVFNIGIPTNGFHPLYAGLLVPVFELLQPYGINVPVYAALIILSTFSVATAVVLYLIGVELESEQAGLLAAFLWLFNPAVVLVSLSGMETPIQCFFISLIILLLITRESKTRLSKKEAVSVGVLIGFAFLSRMDSVLIAGGFFLTAAGYQLWNTYPKSLSSDFFIRFIDRCRGVILSGLIALFVVSPWLLWSYFVVGQLTPVSGEISRHTITSRLGSTISAVSHSLFHTALFVRNYFFYGDLPHNIDLILSAIFISMIVYSIFRLWKTDKFYSLIADLDFLIIGSIIYYGYYLFYQYSLRTYYSLYTSLLITIFLAITLAYLFSQISFPNRILYTTLTIGFVILFLFSGATVYERGISPGNVDKYHGAKYIETNFSGDTNIGAFGTGILQYYTPNQDIINLDGKVNPEAADARQSYDIGQYICEEAKLRYIYHSPDLEIDGLTLRPVQKFPITGSRHTHTLYKIESCASVSNSSQTTVSL